jgi:homoserine O-acetyltransferase
LVDDRLAAPFMADANDFLYQWDASRNYNPAPGLERVQAALLAINSADDERNPPELGIMERELKRIKNGRVYLIPASEDTRGHTLSAHRLSSPRDWPTAKSLTLSCNRFPPWTITPSSAA